MNSTHLHAGDWVYLPQCSVAQITDTISFQNGQQLLDLERMRDGRNLQAIRTPGSLAVMPIHEFANERTLRQLPFLVRPPRTTTTSITSWQQEQRAHLYGSTYNELVAGYAALVHAPLHHRDREVFGPLCKEASQRMTEVLSTVFEWNFARTTTWLANLVHGEVVRVPIKRAS